MAFSEEVKLLAWKRAGGKCECGLSGCGHGARCNADLSGRTWHAHHVVSEQAGGSDALGNCQVLCVPCHENTGSYGRS
jgi:5-methylcytosine-specific restriction protein A